MKVLVLGAGQLAQMMYLAAAPLGVEVMAVDVKDNKIVNPLSKSPYAIDLEFAISDANAITAEFEHIPDQLLALVNDSGKFFPNVKSILAGADRVREKQLLDSYKVANCQHRIISQLDDLQNITADLGERIIFKASRDGYDGYGQWRMKTEQDLDTLSQIFEQLDLKSVPLVAERMADFTREISVIGARDKNGNIACFDIAENLHYEGQLHLSIAPATKLSNNTNEQAQSIFTTIAEALDYTGVLAVELFEMPNGSLLVNEIAPRVHNSGHWTQHGSDTCQFEQHIRAVLGFPLGSIQRQKITAMINIIGCTSFSRDLVSIPGCHLHWYGKSLREKRKMGHINVVADSYQALAKKLQQLSQYLPSEYFPLLEGEANKLSNLDES